MDDLALGIDEELSEVPGDDSAGLHWIVRSEELVDGVRAWPVHLDFSEKREGCILLVPRKLLDLSIRARLLTHELVAWERKDLESLSA